MITRQTWVIADRDGVSIGDLLGATDMSLGDRLGGVPMASFVLPISHHLAPLFITDSQRELTVKVYWDGQLRFIGPVISAESLFSSVQPSEIAVSAMGPMWRMNRRLVGKSQDGEDVEMSGQRPELIRDILNAANSEGDTGIRMFGGQLPETAPLQVKYSFRQALDAIQELGAGPLGAQVADGVDWRVIPLEPGQHAGKMGELVLGSVGVAGGIAPQLIGRNLAGQVFFELGPRTLDNLVDARQPIDRSGMANAMWSVNSEASPKVIFRQDTASIGQRGRYEDVLFDDNLDEKLRTDLLDNHVQVRGRPRRLIHITPRPEDETGVVPRPGFDFDLGDIVRVRVATPEHGLVIDAELRIYEIETQISAAGRATHTIGVAPD